MWEETKKEKDEPWDTISTKKLERKGENEEARIYLKKTAAHCIAQMVGITLSKVKNLVTKLADYIFVKK